MDVDGTDEEESDDDTDPTRCRVRNAENRGLNKKLRKMSDGLRRCRGSWTRTRTA